MSPRRCLPLAALLGLAACGEKAPPEVAADATEAAPSSSRSVGWSPLPPPPFEPPQVSSGSLSNGVSVEVVENHEVPLVTVRLELEAGSWTDSAAAPGLASVTMDMLNEGAGDLDAAGLSRELKIIAASLSAHSSLDSSTVELTVLEKNLDRGLELMALLLTEPSFPESEWTIVQKQRLAGLAEARSNPNSVAGRVFDKLVYGEQYDGLLNTEAAYEAMDPDDMRDWWGRHGVPAQARLSVGGAVTLDDVLPRLEAALSGWQGGEALSLDKPQASALPELDSSVLYLVDKPGAAQSVIRAGLFTVEQSDESFPALILANQAFGGYFSARLNMNLREDKGWTYGARSGVYFNYLPSVFMISTGVITAHTAESVAEIQAELQAMSGDRPLTQDELDAGRGYRLGTLPLRYEDPGYLLGQRSRIARYDLAEDWIETWPDRLRAVTVEEAQAAWDAHVREDRLVILVVGDKEVVGEDLAALGRPIVELDADGEPVTD